jgi:hypothetical protein
MTTTKNQPKVTVRSLLERALKDKAGGKPTVLAKLIDYNYPNLAGVRRGDRKLPEAETERLCKLMGRTDWKELHAAQHVVRPKRVNDRMRQLLRSAIRTKAEGRPEKLAELIGYDYTNFVEVVAGFRALPFKQTGAFCKLMGRSDAKDLHGSQQLE